MSNRIEEIHTRLFDHFGAQHWWPGETPFEIMLGAVLTQNTSWRNVSMVIEGLRREGLLSFAALDALPLEALAEKIRPSGYYNQKAKRIKGLFAAIREDSGSLEEFFAQETQTLREKLLAIKGIGPETADSITLYAAAKPVFVVDAYTYRILLRHDLIAEDAGYEEIQDLFLSKLPAEAQLFNEYHALLVRLAKEYCKKSNPLCDSCPLQGF
ncbi:endonuclease III domain-containing protein [Thiovibrio frasassiensis]|uniref:Endonuclease III domain-containing protein n=1 Tax=Thiovibrio frasassiensis TaxID=2984131 RepID=A0A9X4MM28_9BACT|nr:endonuclease III domain-containing protein [Thiovibrio frasassiensis]MDG4475292.1 endonuclease III domain-containing protein [Thiovibrio frasassiensis]